MTKTIGIYVFDEVELLDLAGPYEVFTTATRMQLRTTPDQPPFRVVTIAERAAPIRARAGLPVLPDHAITDHPPLDVLVVPGGVVDAELGKPPVIDWIRRTARATRLTASVCTGAFLLARAGLLDGRRATTHWEDMADLSAAFPQVKVQGGVRWIDEGAIVTSAGITAGIDMSLHLVARLMDEALALRTARQMDFQWTRG